MSIKPLLEVKTSISSYQAHPYHLVSPSPWPILTSLSLLVLTTSGVLSMHNFLLVNIFFFQLYSMLSMILWSEM